jgi:hypothetical protein
MSPNKLGSGAMKLPVVICAIALQGVTVLFAQTVSSAGNMLHARSNHTATLLNDGRILLAGGYDRGPVAQSEIYDPSTGAFTAAGSMIKPRDQSAAVRLDDGRVLILGGQDAAGFTASAEVFDPATGMFSAVGSMSIVRIRPAVALLDDGRVLVAGGRAGVSGDVMRSAELFDPLTDTFSLTGSMISARDGAAAAVLQDGSVLIVGGGSVCELYDPVTGTLTATAPTSIISFPKLAALRDGRVLAEAFGAAQTYDPGTRTFTTTPTVPILRADEVITQLPGVVILTGGFSTTTTAAVDDVETFDVSSYVFRTTGHLLTRRMGHTATPLGERRILIAGGFHDPDLESLASAEIYELAPRAPRRRSVRH